MRRAFVLGWSLVGLGTGVASSAEYPRAYVSERQVWIQRSASEVAFQATHGCAVQSTPAVSPDRTRIAYGVACVGNDQQITALNLVVLDWSGKEVGRCAPLRMKTLASTCTQAEEPEWIDDGHIAVVCEYNPSVEDELVVDARTGEIVKEYTGLWFTWSPDHKTVAYVGFIVHFAPPSAQNYCLLLNGRTIYTRDCSNEVKEDKSGSFGNIHTFGYPLAWSRDGDKIAFVEEVFDWAFDPAPNETGSGKSSHERYYLVIACADQPTRGYRLQRSEYSSNPALSWISPSQIKLGGKIYDLAKNKPELIP